jgi:restriction system protein
MASFVGHRPPSGRCYSAVGEFSLQGELRLCPLCGWWSFRHYLSFNSDAGSVYETHGVDSSLLDFQRNDLSAPLRLLRNHLAANPEDRFYIHPTRLEDMVASIFRDFGYDVEVTGRTGDGGIDVVLRDESGRIAVQVKRYRNSLEVEQIRSFLGAMVLDGTTRGIFVTTSRFQSGSSGTVLAAQERGFEVELVDGERFLQALGVAQLRYHRSIATFDEACDRFQVPKGEYPTIKRFVLKSGEGPIDDGSGIID